MGSVWQGLVLRCARTACYYGDVPECARMNVRRHVRRFDAIPAILDRPVK